MSKLVCAALMIFAAGLSCAAEAPLTIMTFNVRYGTALDGPNAWPNRKDLLVETIRQSNPDILGTQECLKMQAEYIAGKFPGYQWFGRGREADGSGEMMAVFYKTEILESLESGHFWLSETPDVPGSKSWNTNCSRMATWIKFKHRSSGKTFFYFNSHFDHVSEEARVQSASLLAKRFDALPADSPVFLTADFNAAGETSAAWKTLVEAGMKDAWLTAEKRLGPNTTWSEFKAPDPKNNARIDWILYRGNVRALTCDIITYNQDGRYPSDHYPVTAHLLLLD